jgi:membrane protease YdiL (CAAX protease family)
MPVTFVLLVLAVCAAWLPPAPAGKTFRLHLWMLLYAASVAAAVVQGFVAASGVAALVVLVALAWWLTRAQQPGTYWLAFALLLALCLALGMHKVPGFHNPIAIDKAQVSADGKPFTQYLNFDKGAVGLVLVAFVAPRLRRGDAWRRVVTNTVLAYLATSAAVFAVALAAGLVHIDPKLPPQTAMFLVTNLLLTCVAEQAFFRTLVHDPLRGVLPGRPMPAAAPSVARGLVAIAVSSVAFGLSHAYAGAPLVAMAMLAGLGYAAAYAMTNRIEAPVFVQFALNATHFLLFTYPL